jgi:hypothetical protein
MLMTVATLCGGNMNGWDSVFVLDVWLTTIKLRCYFWRGRPLRQFPSSMRDYGQQCRGCVLQGHRIQ